MAGTRLVIDVKGWPDALWVMRHELAEMLRQQAEAEASGYVAERLREIAAQFESGVRKQP